MKKFSLVIPTFNSEVHIEETLVSALQQAGEDFEVLIDDNNSSDKTLGIVRSYLKDSRLKLFDHKEDLNIPNGWNRALKQGTGSFRLLLHSDNLLHPQFLSLAREFHRRFPFDVFYTECIYFNDVSSSFSWGEIPSIDEIPVSFLSPGARAVNYLFRFERMVPTSCVLMNWNLFQSRSPYSPQYQWDPDIELMNYLGSTAKILHVQIPLVAIRTHEGQVSSWKHRAFSTQYYDLLAQSHQTGRTEKILFLREWAGSNYDVCKKLALSKGSWKALLRFSYKWMKAELKILAYILRERLQKAAWLLSLWRQRFSS